MSMIALASKTGEQLQQAENDTISLARAIERRGGWQEAVALLEELLHHNPARHEARHLLGDIYMRQRLQHDAWRCYWQVATQVPDTWQVWYSMLSTLCHCPDDHCLPGPSDRRAGLASYITALMAAAQLQAEDEALPPAERAAPFRLLAQLLTDSAELLAKAPSALTLPRVGEWILNAARAWESLTPDAESQAHLALGHHFCERYREAIPHWEAALAGMPSRPQWRGLYALALSKIPDLDSQRAARDQYLLTIAEAPDHHIAMGNLAFILQLLGDREAAGEWIARAYAAYPESPRYRFSLACRDLSEGRLAEGFAGYETRAELHADPHSQKYQQFETLRARGLPRWQAGDDIRGKRVLVVVEQGFGDFFMVSRFLPALTASAGATHVTVMTYPALLRYANALPLPGEYRQQVHALGTVDVAQFDLYVMSMSLPRLLGLNNAADIPPPLPPCLDPASLPDWAARLAPPGRARVGLTWRGNAEHNVDVWRSIPFDVFLTGLVKPLLALGFSLVSLQKDVTPTEDAALAVVGVQTAPIAATSDWLATAELMQTLDTVVAVDTALVHLAGTLGKPVLLLDRIGSLSDWRWGLGQQDCPWYPSLTLCRQQQAGEWSGVFSAALEALSATWPQG